MLGVVTFGALLAMSDSGYAWVAFVTVVIVVLIVLIRNHRRR